ncbi:hypothetical protein A2U01_0085115, partial [Trifolium medium]|nr:hypothetical protein [Trifolium medium]
AIVDMATVVVVAIAVIAVAATRNMVVAV